jgi:hypothetical protein
LAGGETRLYQASRTPGTLLAETQAPTPLPQNFEISIHFAASNRTSKGATKSRFLLLVAKTDYFIPSRAQHSNRMRLRFKSSMIGDPNVFRSPCWDTPEIGHCFLRQTAIVRDALRGGLARQFCG